MEKLAMVYVTASSRKEAVKVGQEMVSLRLAACANIYGSVTSFYRWEGKEESSDEATLILKTKESLLEDLSKAIKEMHSYSCPGIVAIPIIFADEEYAQWIISATK